MAMAGNFPLSEAFSHFEKWNFYVGQTFSKISPCRLNIIREENGSEVQKVEAPVLG